MLFIATFYCCFDVKELLFNPYITNGLSHPYHLVESTFFFRGNRGNFAVFFNFSMKFLKVNSIAPDETSRFAASHPAL